MRAVYSRESMKNSSLPEALPEFPLLDTYGEWSLINQYGLEFIDKNKVVKIAEDETEVAVGLVPGENHELLHRRLVRHHAPKSVRLYRVAENEFSAALARLYSRDASSDTFQAKHRNIDALDKVAGDAPTINLVNSMILDGVNAGASDIHIEGSDQTMIIRNRLDGALRKVAEYPAERFSGVSSRLKLMAHLNIMESRKPQDGRITVTLQSRAIHMRISVVPLVRGESIVLRLFHREDRLIRPVDLGFPPEAVAFLRSLFQLPYGLVLVTGPTGSGKSTTLNAFLTEIKDDEKKIITMEDPVEYVIPGLDQIQVHEEIGLTFGALLRRVLRQDPDVIMVGEIRDEETAELAVRAALTGHLVLATLHTNDAPTALNRLTDMGIPPYLVGAVLRGVLAQRLVRKLCQECRRERTPTNSERLFAERCGRSLNACFDSFGCDFCAHEGFKGRTAIAEWFPVDRELEEIIGHSENPTQAAMEILRKNGYEPLLAGGIRMVNEGITTIAELRKVALI